MRNPKPETCDKPVIGDGAMLFSHILYFMLTNNIQRGPAPTKVKSNPDEPNHSRIPAGIPPLQREWPALVTLSNNRK
jgi:hypothetical protein